MVFFSEGVVHSGIESVQLGLRLHDQSLPVLGGQWHSKLRHEVVINLVERFLGQEIVIGATVTKLLIQLQVKGRFPAQLLRIKGGREVQQIFFVAAKNGVLPVIITKPDPLLGEVDRHVKRLDHWASNQHRRFARQNKSLVQAVLSIQIDWDFDRP